jgi:hypothetical protein
MFRAFIDHLKANIFQWKEQSGRTVYYWIPCCLQDGGIKVFLSIKHCWAGCSISKTLCRCLLLVMKVRLHAGNQTWHFSLTCLIFCRLAVLAQTFSCSFAYGTSWRQSWVKVCWRPQLLRYDNVQSCRCYTVYFFLILTYFSLPL